MLEAGGLPPQTDRERDADVDNPKGYYEWEPIKQIEKKPELLEAEGLDGRAIKCISMLLQRLPIHHNYKVIFMTRPIAEVVASQGAMLDRLATKGAELDVEQLQRGLTAHRNEIQAWMKRAPHIKFIEIEFPSLINDPSTALPRIAKFLGADRLPTPEKMTKVVDSSLYRRKLS